MKDVWQALSHPVRREILALLREGAMGAGAIGEKFDMAGASLSQHLKTLREAGLVSVEADGTARIYRLNVSVAEDALTGLLDLLGVGTAPISDRKESNT